MPDNEKIRVAIACQGGGSHTAFTAGALKRILRRVDGKYDIVAFSGSSGGAICALMARYGMLTEGRDRSNELAGNLSLPQEAFFIEKVNEWIDQGYLPEGEYKHIEMRWIQNSREDLDIASKFDRSPSFIRDMMAYGEERAGDFLAGLP